MSEDPQIPMAYFGSVGDKEPDWRKSDADDTPDDDEELEKTPDDVVEMLGFDPKELDDVEDSKSKKLDAVVDALACLKEDCGSFRGRMDAASDYKVVNEDGYIKVKHPNHGVVAAGRFGKDGRISNIEITEKKFYHKSIRQPAMVAMQAFEKKMQKAVNK